MNKRQTIKKLILGAPDVPSKLKVALYGKDLIDTPAKELAATWSAIRRLSKEAKKRRKYLPELLNQARQKLSQDCYLAVMRGDSEFFRGIAEAMEWYETKFRGGAADPYRLAMLAGLASPVVMDADTLKPSPISPKDIKKSPAVQKAIAKQTSDKFFYRDLKQLMGKQK